MLSPLRSAIYSLIAAAVLPGLALPASGAEESTPPAASAPITIAIDGNTPPNANLPANPTRARKGREPLFDLTLSLEKYFPTSADQLTPPGVLNESEVFPSGVFTIHFSNKFRGFFRRINHFDVGGRQYRAGVPSYGGVGYDAEYQEGFAYAFSPDLEIQELYKTRWRLCCPGAGDPTNKTPRQLQGPLTGFTGKFGPKSSVLNGKPIEAHVEFIYADHHLDLGTGLPAGTLVTGRTWIYKATLYGQLPLFGKNFVPFAGFEHFDDFFNNQLVPTWTNRSEYGFRLRGSSYVSYRAYVKNDHQDNPSGDVPHKVGIFLETTFKLHSRDRGH